MISRAVRILASVQEDCTTSKTASRPTSGAVPMMFTIYKIFWIGGCVQRVKDFDEEEGGPCRSVALNIVATETANPSSSRALKRT